MTTDEIATLLQGNKADRSEAEQRLKDLRVETDTLVVQGYEAGISKLALARAAGLTRQTIYSIILRNQAQRAA